MVIILVASRECSNEVNLEITKQCLEEVFRHKRETFDGIVGFEALVI